MSITNEAVNVPQDWAELYTLAGQAAGTELILQNVGVPGDIIEIAISDSTPDSGFRGIRLDQLKSFYTLPAGNQSVYVRFVRAFGHTDERDGLLQVQLSTGVAPYAKTLATIEKETTANKTLTTDAWARMKTVHDVSLFHGMFTESVPVALWRELHDNIEQAATSYATSINGKLRVESSTVNGEVIGLASFRNPRYEPNRGHLYSVSAFLPNKTAAGERNFGIFTPEAGVFFRLKSDGNLYAVIRTEIDSVIGETEELITIPSDWDVEKGWTYDIQFQWRGVGAYFFYMGQKLIHVIDTQGTRTELTMWNPAAPVAFEAINKGDVVAIECGCVDVTSEGGEENGKTYGSISYDNLSGQTDNDITGFNVPILVVRNKLEINGRTNTRDVLALLATAYGDQRNLLRVWATRDETAISLNGQSWTDFGDGHLEYINYQLDSAGNTIASAMTFDTSKAVKVFGARVNMDDSYNTSALFEGRTEIHQTAGDIFIFTMHRETGGQTKVGVTYEFAEAI